jgi:hypothetical protein
MLYWIIEKIRDRPLADGYPYRTRKTLLKDQLQPLLILRTQLSWIRVMTDKVILILRIAAPIMEKMLLEI